MAHELPHPLSNAAQECVDASLEAYRVCRDSMTYLLYLEGDHVEPGFPFLVQRAAEQAGGLAELLMLGDDDYSRECMELSRTCERICNAIPLTSVDGRLRALSAVARRCAQACRRAAQTGTQAA